MIATKIDDRSQKEMSPLPAQSLCIVLALQVELELLAQHLRDSQRARHKAHSMRPWRMQQRQQNLVA